MKVIKSKTLTRSVIGEFDLLMLPLNIWWGPAASPDYTSYATPQHCHCEAPRRGDVVIPLGISGDYPAPRLTSSCAARLRGLLRRFVDSLLAMTTGRISLVYVLDTVPKVYELMQNSRLIVCVYKGKAFLTGSQFDLKTISSCDGSAACAMLDFYAIV